MADAEDLKSRQAALQPSAIKRNIAKIACVYWPSGNSTRAEPRSLTHPCAEPTDTITDTKNMVIVEGGHKAGHG